MREGGLGPIGQLLRIGLDGDAQFYVVVNRGRHEDRFKGFPVFGERIISVFLPDLRVEHVRELTHIVKNAEDTPAFANRFAHGPFSAQPGVRETPAKPPRMLTTASESLTK